jgi:CRISPR-associated protein Csx16
MVAMTTYLVTRHQGTIDWARRRGLVAEIVADLDPTMVGAGDIVHGTLPVHLVAAINARGARFFHLEVDGGERGQEWSADDLERLGARLVEYRAERV